VAQLKTGGLVVEGRLGLFGISMGGFIAYGAAPLQLGSAVVSLIASPAWTVDVPQHPMRHLEQIPPCAILSQLALRDEVVDPDGARRFHAALAPLYSRAPERLELVEYPESAHFMREEDWH